MTCIMIGFTRARPRIGTVYGNGTLTAADTEINAAGPNGGGSGDSTINFPATPSSGQIVTINNTGTGTVTVNGNGNNIGSGASVTLATGVTGTFLWDGYSWGVYYSDCSASELNATHDFGTTSQGPAETPYTVPANTIEYSGWWSNSCGETVRRVITTTYSGRSVANSYKRIYTNMAPVWGSEAWGATIIGYGANSTDADNNAIATAIAECPQNVILPDLGAQYTGGTPITGAIEFHSPTGYELRVKHKVSLNGVPVDGYPYNTYVSDTLISSQLTLYYLDTHIVWTYEIV